MSMGSGVSSMAALREKVRATGRWARRLGRRLAVSITACVLVGAVLFIVLGARGSGQGQPAPTVQFADHVETLSHQDVGNLFVTGLEGGKDEVTWQITVLPCPGRPYLLRDTEADITQVYSKHAEARLMIASQRLSPGLRCGAALPPGANRHRATVAVLRAGSSGGSPTSIYEDGETQLKSFVYCITLGELCQRGRYSIKAALDWPRRHVVLEYSFTIAIRRRATTPSGSTSAGKRIEQCSTL
jgi:hypothetical protein